MPYFVVYIGRDQKTVKNIVTSNHPSKWYENANERILNSGSTDEVTLLWWAEITEEQAKRFDPGYYEERSSDGYDPVFPGLDY